MSGFHDRLVVCLLAALVGLLMPELLRVNVATNLPTLPSGCAISFSSSYTSLAPTGPASGKRFFLFPGLDVNLTTWSSGAPLSLVNTLRAAGHHVVLVPLPAPQSCFFTNGGWQYRDQFVISLNAVMDAVDGAYGPAAMSVAGGLSYGGLHAMMAAVVNGRVAAWFAHVPVVRMDALAEFSGVGDVRRFNPQFDVDALAASRGLITWATADTRVDWQLTHDLSRFLLAKVTKIAYPDQVHETNAQNASDIAAWVAGLP